MDFEKLWDVLPVLLLAISQLATTTVAMDLNRRVKKLEEHKK